jgi:hypothetical protein
VLVALIGACSPGKNSAVFSRGTDTPGPSTTSDDAGDSSTSPSAGPTVTATTSRLPSVDGVVRLAWIGKDGVHVARVAPDGSVSDVKKVSGDGQEGGSFWSDLQWSPKGRYVGWLQGDARVGGSVVFYDVQSGGRHRYDIGASTFTMLSSAILAPVEDRLHVLPTTGAAERSVPMKRHGELLTVGSSAPGRTPANAIGGTPTGVLLHVLLPKGPGVITRIAVDGFAHDVAMAEDGDALLVDGVTDARDKVFAAERGDHTDGCGVPPASTVTFIDFNSGQRRDVPLPAQSGGGMARVFGLSWSHEGRLGAVIANCGNGREYPADFYELHGDTWQLVADEVVAAATGPSGLLAAIHGSFIGEGDAFGATGEQLVVSDPDGEPRVVANAVSELAWAAPRSD